MKMDMEPEGELADDAGNEDFPCDPVPGFILMADETQSAIARRAYVLGLLRMSEGGFLQGWQEEAQKIEGYLLGLSEGKKPRLEAVKK